MAQREAKWHRHPADGLAFELRKPEDSPPPSEVPD